MFTFRRLSRRRLRRWMIVLGGLLVILAPPPASAHPLDQLLHTIRTQLQPQGIVLNIQLVAGPLVTPRLWDELDADGSAALDEREIDTWCRRYLDQLKVQFDDQTIALTVHSIEQFPRQRQEFIGQGATYLTWSAQASWPQPVTPGAHDLWLAGSAYPEISLYDWSKTRGVQGIVVREATRLTQFASHFPIKWPANLTAQPPAPAAPGLEDGPALASSTAATRSLLGRLQGANLTAGLIVAALGAALVFGALHALQPGHGKTLVAAYLVGSRGTVRHAVLLGGIVTLTHTSSVLILGSLVLTLSAWIKPERIIPGLTLISGGLVVLLGLRLIWSRITNPAADHHHHAGEFPHQHEHGHPHHHAPAGINRALVSLGISGGLVPCTEALVILIVAATIGRLALGLAMIVAFSLGLAAVLIGLGILLVTLGDRLAGRLTRLSSVARWLPIVSAGLVVGLGCVLAFEGWRQIGFS